VRFGRSPIDIDEYFYDDDDDSNKEDDVDFISPRSARRHYVRFGRDGSSGRHYIRFGRNAGISDAEAAVKRASRHYVRFGRAQSQQLNSDEEKRAHYVRFGRAGEIGLHDEFVGSDNDRIGAADKRPNYVRFG